MSTSSPAPTTAKKPLLSSDQYTLLKHVVSIVLPALAAIYFALGQVWHFPDVAEVMATIAGANTVLGGLLGYSTATYNASESKYAGIIETVEDDAKITFNLITNGHPANIKNMTEAIFKVQPQVTPVSVAQHGASIPPPA